MKLKIKVLGMGLLAVMATGAFAVMNAGATVGGHFTTDAVLGHAIVIGTESTASTHRLAFVREGDGAESELTCHQASYTGTVSAATVQSVTITPAWSNCTTGTTGAGTSFDIHENGCSLTFTSGSIGQTHHTVDLVCLPEEGIDLTHPNCTVTLPSQTMRGITYTTTTENSKHALTMNVTIKGITAHHHGGICIFLGTTHQWEVKGSVTIKATNTDTQPVNFTETTG